MGLTTPGSGRCPMSGGPTPGSVLPKRGVTVSCCGQDEANAALVATEASVSPAWLSRQPHAAPY